jgi:WxcM-like, C-terminal.
MNSIVYLKKIGKSDLGYLSFFESNRDIPFEIKRVYFTYDVPVNGKRGMHAHKNLQQVLWCPHGIIEVELDDGETKEAFLLDSPEKALLVGSGIWRDIYWRMENSILCVASSDYYNEDDYIRDYNDFKSYLKVGYWKDENKLQSVR